MRLSSGVVVLMVLCFTRYCTECKSITLKDKVHHLIDLLEERLDHEKREPQTMHSGTVHVHNVFQQIERKSKLNMKSEDFKKRKLATKEKTIKPADKEEAIKLRMDQREKSRKRNYLTAKNHLRTERKKYLSEKSKKGVSHIFDKKILQIRNLSLKKKMQEYSSKPQPNALKDAVKTILIDYNPVSKKSLRNKKKETKNPCTQINVAAIGETGSFSSENYPEEYAAMQYQCVEFFIPDDVHVSFQLNPDNDDEIDIAGDNIGCQDSVRFVESPPQNNENPDQQFATDTYVQSNVQNMESYNTLLHIIMQDCNFDDVTNTEEEMDAQLLAETIERCAEAVHFDIELDEDAGLMDLLDAMMALMEHVSQMTTGVLTGDSAGYNIIPSDSSTMGSGYNVVPPESSTMGSGYYYGTPSTDMSNLMELPEECQSEILENADVEELETVIEHVEDCAEAIGFPVDLDDADWDDVLNVMAEMAQYAMDAGYGPPDSNYNYGSGFDSDYDVSSYHEQEFCGKIKKPETLHLFVTTSNYARLEFLSNDFPNGRGYKISYETVDDQAACSVSEYGFSSYMLAEFCYSNTPYDIYGANNPGMNWPECKTISLKGNNGELITSEGYEDGDDYPSYARQCWSITGMKNENIVIKVPKDGVFNIEESFDLVGFIDANDDSQTINLRTGEYDSEDVLFVSKSNKDSKSGVNIYFYADSSVEMSGFQLQALSVKDPEESLSQLKPLDDYLSQCDRLITEDSTVDTTELTCLNALIIIQAPKGKQIELDFTEGIDAYNCVTIFEKESPLWSKCYEAAGPLVKTFVSTGSNLEVSSSGTKFDVRIHD